MVAIVLTSQFQLTIMSLDEISSVTIATHCSATIISKHSGHVGRFSQYVRYGCPGSH